MSQDSNDFSLKQSANFIKMVLFSSKTLFLNCLRFPMAVIIKTAKYFPHYGQLPSAPQHGLGSFHHPRREEVLDLMVEPRPSLPLGCFIPGFVSRECVWVDSSLPPLFLLAFDPPLKAFSLKWWPRPLASSARVMSRAVTPPDGALGTCRCVFHRRCLSVIAAGFYLFQSKRCAPAREGKLETLGGRALK